MKRAHLTIGYVVYPPNYVPGDGYVRAKNRVAAMRQARRFGVGASINRNVAVRHTPGRKVGFCSGHFSYQLYMTLDRVCGNDAYWSQAIQRQKVFKRGITE